MHDGVKKSTGPSGNKAASLKSKSREVITDKAKQLERWVEHYPELYSRETVVLPSVLDDIDRLQMIPERDEELSTEELSTKIDRLPAGKAPGKDCIPAEVIKSGKSVLLVTLYKLLIQCWREGSVPQDMRDANIVTLYKNKGNRCDCDNCHGILLLSIVGKLYVRIVLQTADSC